MTDEPLSIAVDLSALNMGDLADAMEVAGVDDLANAKGAEQVRLTAAFAWVVRRREDESFSYADALALPMGAISVSGTDAVPETLRGASSGAPLPESVEPGPSIQVA